VSLTRNPPAKPAIPTRSDARLSVSRILVRVISRASGVALAAAAAWLAYDLPFARGYVVGVLIICAAAQLRFPDAWLIFVPALLPVFDLTLWSGRLYINEFDLLVLTAASVHFLRAPDGRQFPKFTSRGNAIIAVLAVSFLVAMVIGAVPLPTPDANQLGSYLSNYNALRIAKSFIWALLLLAPLQWRLFADARRTTALLIIGTSIGLLLVGLVVLWERGVLLAIVQSHGHLYASRYEILGALLDYTSEYRATALFSELHTGGEAIDTYLAVAPPIAAAGVLAFRHPIPRLFCLAALCLGAYAVVATFSRGLYLGFGGGMATVFIVAAINSRARLHGRWVAVRAGAATVVTIAALVASFAYGGFDALCLGLAVSAFSLVIAHLIGGRSRVAAALALCVPAAAGCYALWHAFLFSHYNVTNAQTALAWAAGCSAALAGSAALLGGRTIANENRITAAIVFVLFAVVAGIAVPATGGTRMLERFSTSSVDAQTRWNHWAEAFSLMGPDWQDYAFGLGLGTFPQRYFRRGIGTEPTASYRYMKDAYHAWLEIGAMGDFNMTQKIPLQPETKYQLSLMVRGGGADARLDLKLCPKLILFSDRYTPDCQEFVIPATPALEWIRHDIAFDSGALGKDAPFGWPMTLMVGNASASSLIGVTGIVLTDGQRNIVSNGDFSAGGDRWIMISDFEHLAWHIKNLFLEVFFENGAIGLIIFSFALTIALINSLRAARRNLPIAAGVAGAFVAFALVGLTGSLFDNPRPALLFLIFLMWALQPVPRPAPGARASNATSAVRRPYRPLSATPRPE